MLDDVFLPNGRFIPVISDLGSYVTRDGTDSKDKDVRARINSVPLVRIWSTIKVHFSIDTRQP